MSEATPPDHDRVETFGCRLNAFESEVIRGHLSLPSERPRIIFNTCAVTAEAERQARQ
ncbi:MAG: tRNA (N(6)-L-threonylcarbamoyladenosine(37)-C(2))-methylthiotransferase MtaB, partial [Alphaproteobacteria bacterium]|nr:tRNA (N(6)-L-threonylcarbamoyladenosine(37)-C(2))-methylthiotransferase MtaB [Alphaproteobacteria bacterium]